MEDGSEFTEENKNFVLPKPPPPTIFDLEGYENFYFKNEECMEDTDSSKKAQVTVKFTITPSTSKGPQVFTNSYPHVMTIEGIIDDLSSIFQVQRDDIYITKDGKRLGDKMKVKDLIDRETDILRLGLLSVKGVPLKVNELYSEFAVADVITVHCEDSGIFYDLIVEIEARPIIKPFVGGYRHIVTNTEYHHAFTQTGPAPPKTDPALMVSRDIQTMQSNDKSQNTACHHSVQFSNENIAIPNVTDVILTPKPYVTFAELEMKRCFLKKVKLIQRNFRRYMWLKLIKDTASKFRNLMEIFNKAKAEQERKELNSHRRDTVIRTYPRSQADFDQLYTMIHRWREAEVQRISSQYTAAPRVAEFALLLDKEIEMFTAIEKHKINAHKDKELIRDYELISFMQTPVTWKGYKGAVIEMDTLRTQKARRYAEIYRLLSSELTHEERIETNISLKAALQNEPRQISLDLIRLIDRETDLITREVKSSDLQTLRKRILGYLLDFMKDPDNEGCSSIGWLSRCKTPLDFYMCKYCSKLKPVSLFPMTAKIRSYKVCFSCDRMGQVIPKDHIPYSRILKCIRDEEKRRKCLGSVAFLITESDIQYLIDAIWHGRSAVSETGHLRDLRLPRWLTKKDWSPWNCILMTCEEQIAHQKLGNILKVYDPAFIEKVEHKHLQAKSHFKQLCTLNARFVFCKKFDTAHCIDKYCPE